jgi:uncharacterized protein YggU (UPF0235/DUF167 family)
VLKVRVAAAPDRGRANAAAIALVAKSMDVPKSKLEITAGHTARLKTLEVTGDGEMLAARLDALAGRLAGPKP